MDEISTNPLDGCHIAHPTRKLGLVAQNLEINRAWSWSSLSREEPQFAISISGQAVSETSVCVLGTTLRSKIFHLTFNSDLEATQSWERTKRIEVLVGRDAGDPERLRIRNLQYEEFNKTPPTATLWYHSGWTLECEIPLMVLTQLSEDLVTCGIKRVRMEIEWPFGLVENGSASWGFFEGSQLRGYVNKLSWSLPTLEPNATADLNRDAPPAPHFTEPTPGISTRTVRSHFFGRKSR